MKYKSIPSLRNPVSRLILGTSVRGITEGAASEKIFDAAYFAGINTFDTARCYGMSESVLGKWIASRKIRDKVNIITKCCHPDESGSRVTPKALKSDVEASLKALSTDYIDILLLHRDDTSLDVREIVEALAKLRREGKVIAYGASNWTHSRIEEANSYAKAHNLPTFAVSSPCCSVVKRVFDPWGGSVDITGDIAAQRWYIENKMPVFAYSSLARGYLSEKKPPRVTEYDCPENEKILKDIKTEAKRLKLSVAQAALVRLLKSEMELFPIAASGSPAHIEALAAVV